MNKSDIYFQDLSTIASLSLPWHKIKNKSVLITGATGLIGRVLVDLLMYRNKWNNDNVHVIALSRNEDTIKECFKEYSKNKLFTYVIQDIKNPITIDYFVDYIIHCASNADPVAYATDPVGTMTGNFLGMNNLLQYAKKYNVERTIYLSSGEVYGEIESGQKFIEDNFGYVDYTTSRACYPSSKRATEILCLSYFQQFKVDIIIARLSHVYGPTFTKNDSRVFAQFFRRALAEKDIIMKSNGLQVRSYCYVADAVSALMTLLFCGTPGEAYNVADNNSNISIRQLAEYIASAVGRKVIIKITNDLESKGYSKVETSIFDTSKLESLGWEPKTKIKEGLIKSINILSQKE